MRELGLTEFKYDNDLGFRNSNIYIISKYNISEVIDNYETKSIRWMIRKYKISHRTIKKSKSLKIFY